MQTKPKPKRQRDKQIKVPVLPSETSAIKANAKQCGLTMAAYLRTLGLRHQPKTILDSDAVLELAKINGDLGRLGGLLKMWLTNQNRFDQIGKEAGVESINSLLDEITKTQAMLFETAQRV